MDYSKIKSEDEAAELGEKDAAILLGIKLHPHIKDADHHSHGVDAIDEQGKRNEIKARAVRTIKIKPWKTHHQAAKIAKKDVLPHVRVTKGVPNIRLSLINDPQANQISIPKHGVSA